MTLTITLLPNKSHIQRSWGLELQRIFWGGTQLSFKETVKFKEAAGSISCLKVQGTEGPWNSLIPEAVEKDYLMGVAALGRELQPLAVDSQTGKEQGK